jgi:hypothetical protein
VDVCFSCMMVTTACLRGRSVSNQITRTMHSGTRNMVALIVSSSTQRVGVGTSLTQCTTSTSKYNILSKLFFKSFFPSFFELHLMGFVSTTTWLTRPPKLKLASYTFYTAFKKYGSYDLSYYQPLLTKEQFQACKSRGPKSPWYPLTQDLMVSSIFNVRHSKFLNLLF